MANPSTGCAKVRRCSLATPRSSPRRTSRCSSSRHLLHGLATAPLALVLLVAERSGSYAGAGVVSASYMVTNGAVAPLWGRCVDRLGPRRVAGGIAIGLTLGGTVHEAAGTGVALLSAAAAALLELAALIARRGTLGRSMNGV